MELLQGQFATSSKLDAAWGVNRVVKLANPAEGQVWKATVLGGFVWVPVAIRYTFAAGAEAGERSPGFAVESGSDGVMAEGAITPGFEEGKSGVVSFLRGWTVEGGAKNVSVSAGLPHLQLEEGWSIAGFVRGLAAKDKLTAITLWVEEYETKFDHSADRVRQAIHEMDRAERGLENG